MLIKQTDYADLERAIAPLIALHPKPSAMTDERYRWDLLHASSATTGHLYRYLNDSHIDTALAKIVRIATR